MRTRVLLPTGLLVTLTLCVSWALLQRVNASAHYILNASIVPSEQQAVEGDCLLRLATAHKLEAKAGTTSLAIHENWNRFSGLESGRYRRLTISLESVPYDHEITLPSDLVRISYSFGGTAWLNRCIDAPSQVSAGSITLHKHDGAFIEANISLYFSDKDTFSGKYTLMKTDIEGGNRFSNMLIHE